ncbi:putative nuclease of restriction endonuclease-like (RecB) superfamily [Pedobacter sp. CG_S7]
MKGLSRTNLSYAKQFFEFYQSSIVQQAVGQLQTLDDIKPQHPIMQIPWGLNILIFSKANDVNEAYFYIQETMENGWSRDVLALQIKTNTYNRQGKAITNF